MGLTITLTLLACCRSVTNPSASLIRNLGSPERLLLPTDGTKYFSTLLRHRVPGKQPLTLALVLILTLTLILNLTLALVLTLNLNYSQS